MTTNQEPETLGELLRALERSTELRSLARECGLSVRELRRRLAIWRRELQDPNESDSDSKPVLVKNSGDKAKSSAETQWPELIFATDVAENPLPDPQEDIMEIFSDGASRGNPGPASIGVLFRMKDGEDLCEYGEAIGKCTNNVAEYQAVVSALEHCRRWGVKRVHLFMDSELIVRQLTGAYRVKSPDLRPLFQRVVFLSKGLKVFRVKHVKRALNAHADHLANKALDKK